MGRIVVEVMPKPEILDPQGKAIGTGLERMGLTGFAAVRQGKLFHLTVDGDVTEEALATARAAAAARRSHPRREAVGAGRAAGAQDASR